MGQLPTVLMIGPAVLACAIASGICLVRFRRIRRELDRLRNTCEDLERRLRDLEDIPVGAGREEGRLDRKRLEDRLRHMEGAEACVSGKYRHAAQLERSGLDVGQIAEILEVSQTEAEQILMLARSARKAA